MTEDLFVVEPGEVDGTADIPRPQTLLLTFFGGYVLRRGVQVATASVLDVLRRLGVSEHATRSTLSRMARRGLLYRTRRGRNVYLGLTPRLREILHDGEYRIWHMGAVNTQWDGTWTLLGFSLPESWQRHRHVLRSLLLWAGFGSLQGGLWIAPSPVDTDAVLNGLEAAEHVKVFQARALPPTDVSELVRNTWDLAAVAAHYRRFLHRWSGPTLPAAQTDSLGRQLLLETEWLQTIRQDPRLPKEHLPHDWPAVRAQQLFHLLHAELDPAARATAAEVLDTIPDEVGASDPDT